MCRLTGKSVTGTLPKYIFTNYTWIDNKFIVNTAVEKKVEEEGLMWKINISYMLYLFFLLRHKQAKPDSFRVNNKTLALIATAQHDEHSTVCNLKTVLSLKKLVFVLQNH